MFIITLIIFIPLTHQPEPYRLVENQPKAGWNSLNEYENGMGKSETELQSFKMEYTVSKANLDLGKNMLLLENLQFLPNHNETLPK